MPEPRPRDRIAALSDGSRPIRWRPDAPPSRWLSRYEIAARPGDGILTAEGAIRDVPVLFGAQDETFLRGTVGEAHAEALRALFDAARRDRPAAVVLLLASAGVRLHEANAAELALGRALRTLLDARADGIPILAIAVGDVFGGASVLACACDRLALLPGIRFGLSGPRVVEAAEGTGRGDTPGGIYDARARARAGIADLVADDPDTIRGWIAQGMRDAIAFPLRVLEMQERLTTRLDAVPSDDPQPPWVEPLGSGLLRLRPAHGTFGPNEAIAADAALLAADDGDLDRPRTVLIVEDSQGHPATPAAETLGVSQYLAHHAAVLALMRSRGHRLVGYLTGTGHSAAFFVNALQADVLHAAPPAKIVALSPDAIAHVTGLSRERLAQAIEDDELLGHPARHFAALGGIADIVDDERTLRSRISGETVAQHQSRPGEGLR